MSRRKDSNGRRPGRLVPRHRGSAARRHAIWLALPLVAAVAVAAAAVWTGNDGRGPASEAEAGPVHVHGLGVDPADGALFIATHTGLFRSGAGDRTAVRVGGSFQDTMGFTVVGPSRFLGSGHPDLREDLPPLLGLIESTDAGETWEPVSLLGDADFHTLRFAHGRVYGYDVTNDRLLVSRDRGRTWSELSRPGPIADLAVDPSDAAHLIAAAQSQLGPALFESLDGGASWKPVASLTGLLAWPDQDRLYVVSPGGEVFAMPEGRRLELRGKTGGEPAALIADGPDLYVALHDGTIERSTDGGRSWQLRSAP